MQCIRKKKESTGVIYIACNAFYIKFKSNTLLALSRRTKLFFINLKFIFAVPPAVAPAELWRTGPQGKAGFAFSYAHHGARIDCARRSLGVDGLPKPFNPMHHPSTLL